MHGSSYEEMSEPVSVQNTAERHNYILELLQEQGCKILAVSDVSGGYYSEKGLDINALIEYAESNRNSLEGYPNADVITNEELLTLDVDLLAPCAKEDQINRHVAPNIKAKIIAEGANGPTTPLADEILKERGVVVIPDILANAGGVTVSYFEWVQNRQRFYWSEERVNDELEAIITDAFDELEVVEDRIDELVDRIERCVRSAGRDGPGAVASRGVGRV